MKIGTKSILFGAHAFYLHPWFVFVAWWKLYGFPFDPRLWACFFLHDLGYFGKPNMDGIEGEKHPEFAAKIMHWLFDKKVKMPCLGFDPCNDEVVITYRFKKETRWHDMCLYHSRFYSKRDNAQYSQLCVADKLATCLTPEWLYLPCVRWSGEIYEYMKLADSGKYKGMHMGTGPHKQWFRGVKKYLLAWINEHKDIKEDLWTPCQKESINQYGVWR